MREGGRIKQQMSNKTKEQKNKLVQFQPKNQIRVTSSGRAITHNQNGKNPRVNIAICREDKAHLTAHEYLYETYV